MEEPGERLKAFCSITFDNCFVVRDLKIIDGTNGPFVAMPSRKLTAHCPGCGMKNHLRAQYCNQCGKRLDDSRAPKDADGRAKLYADIAHPINSSLSRDDSRVRHRRLLSKRSNGPSSPATFAATTITISNTPMHPARGPLVSTSPTTRQLRHRISARRASRRTRSAARGPNLTAPRHRKGTRTLSDLRAVAVSAPEFFRM